MLALSAWIGIQPFGVEDAPHQVGDRLAHAELGLEFAERTLSIAAAQRRVEPVGRGLEQVAEDVEDLEEGLLVRTLSFSLG